MHHVLCGLSYALFAATVLVALVGTAIAYWAWAHRRPGVSRWQGPGGRTLFRPELFTERGNVLRRRALYWQGAALGLLVIGVVVAFVLSGPAGSGACWRG